MKPRRLVGKLKQTARRVRALRPVTIKGGLGEGLRMDLRRASAWYARGTNEMPIQEAIGEHVRPGGVFFDIGANAGFFSLIAARLAGPRGKVVAFEPVPANAAAIRRNASLNRLANIVVVEAAVADHEGTAELRLDPHPGGAVLASTTSRRDGPLITVPLVTIDGLVERREAPEPTVIKVDVEGAEAAVLAGLARTAQRLKPVLICEFDDSRPELVEPKVEAATAMIQSWGYTVKRLREAYPGLGWTVAHIVATGR